LRATRPLRLIDLSESGALVRLGADARLFSGSHANSQSWSKALHDHPRKADGLLTPSRLDPARSTIALFGDRAPKLVELSRQSWYGPGEIRISLAAILDHYDLELIEDHFVAQRKPASRVVQPRIFPEG